MHSIDERNRENDKRQRISTTCVKARFEREMAGPRVNCTDCCIMLSYLVGGGGGCSCMLCCIPYRLVLMLALTYAP